MLILLWRGWLAIFPYGLSVNIRHVEMAFVGWSVSDLVHVEVTF